VGAKTVLYVYGTLRPGGSDIHHVPGVMYALGWFPGVKLGTSDASDFFVTEKIEVDDARLRVLDDYEGYNRAHPELSFFKRVPYQDGFIYVYNDKVHGKERVSDGDWLKYRKSKEGSASKIGVTVTHKADTEVIDDMEENAA
jgi:gamma-glutamylcyclotransferase (GGCT)/AIG2-like uncharacterized protein YtfP